MKATQPIFFADIFKGMPASANLYTAYSPIKVMNILQQSDKWFGVN